MLSYSGYFFIKELNNTIKNNEQTFVHVKKTAEYYGENNLLFNEHIKYLLWEYSYGTDIAD